MTLTDRKGNIRGREFPTDTGIDGNACEETSKDQRWVGLCRQIPDTDTRPTSLSFSLSFLLSLSSSSSSLLPRSVYLFLSRLTSRHRRLRPFVRTPRSTAHNTHRNTSLPQSVAHDVPRISTTMGIRSGAVPRGNDRGGGHRATTTSLTHGPLSYDSRYFEKHQAHPYQVNNNRRSDWWIGVTEGGVRLSLTQAASSSSVSSTSASSSSSSSDSTHYFRPRLTRRRASSDDRERKIER